VRPDHAARAADAGRRPRASSTRRLVPRTLDSNVSSQTHDGDIPLTAGAYLRVIWALSGYDGMCRPWGYQAFVFFRGAFAGTLSPDAMNSRTDASLSSVQLAAPGVAGDLLVATFQRYADSDPLCRPSRRTLVRYRIDRIGSAPILVPVGALGIVGHVLLFVALTCVDSERRHFVGPEADWTASSGMDSRAAAAN